MKRRPRGARKTAILEVWRKVAGELGGEVVVDRRGKPKWLLVPHRQWMVVVDTYTQSNGQSSSTYTRVRALFVRAAPFTLRVTRRNPFHAVGALFGYRPVPIGHARMDRTLFVRSARADIARSMLRGTALGQALLREPVKLVVMRPGKRIHKVAGEAVGEVQLLKGGRVREVATLRALVQICTQTLDEIERLDMATEARVEGVSIQGG